MTYRAHVIETPDTWTHGTVRLLLADERGNVITEDGTWEQTEEGASPMRSGIILPRSAIEPILEAIETWLGIRTHASTEAAVLREWLAVEQARVERILER